MRSERSILIVFVALLAVVIGAASLAIQRPSFVPEQVSVEELPLSNDHALYGPDPEACAAAGGTPHWEVVHECFSDPNVRDVCGFGVPCITGDNEGTVCRDAKASFCFCDTDAECPDGTRCEGDRCFSR